MGRKQTVRRLVACIMTLCMSLCSCENRSAEKQLPSLFAFDTVFFQRVTGAEEDLMGQVAVLLDGEEKQFSRTLTESRLYALNEAGGGKAEGDLLSLLEEALAVARRTDGAFDPTLAYVSDLWDFENQTLPAENERLSALARCGYEKVTVTADGAVDLGGTNIDLGGIAKGYGVGAVLSLYRQQGLTGGLVSCSSSVGMTGTKGDGRLYEIGLKHPDGDGRLLGTLSVSDCILSTSGDSEKKFVKDGVRYHHILDPQTGLPAGSGLRSVTVTVFYRDSDDLALLGARADALSTALFVLGDGDKARSLLKEYGMEAVFVYADKRVSVTEGLRDKYTHTDGDYRLTEG